MGINVRHSRTYVLKSQFAVSSCMRFAHRYPPFMRRIAAILAVVVICGGHVLAGEVWTQFRGPDNGRSDAKSVPLKWSESEHVVWKTEVHGRAWSSPVVMGDQIWRSTATKYGL